MGTKARRSYRVAWVLTASEKTTLVSFFDDRDGGEEAFTWTAPGDSSTSLAALNSGVSVSKLAPDAFEVSAELLEVF